MQMRLRQVVEMQGLAVFAGDRAFPVVDLRFFLVADRFHVVDEFRVVLRAARGIEGVRIDRDRHNRHHAAMLQDLPHERRGIVGQPVRTAHRHDAVPERFAGPEERAPQRAIGGRGRAQAALRALPERHRRIARTAAGPVARDVQRHAGTAPRGGVGHHRRRRRVGRCVDQLERRDARVAFPLRERVDPFEVRKQAGHVAVAIQALPFDERRADERRLVRPDLELRVDGRGQAKALGLVLCLPDLFFQRLFGAAHLGGLIARPRAQRREGAGRRVLLDRLQVREAPLQRREPRAACMRGQLGRCQFGEQQMNVGTVRTVADRRRFERYAAAVRVVRVVPREPAVRIGHEHAVRCVEPVGQRLAGVVDIDVMPAGFQAAEFGEAEQVHGVVAAEIERRVLARGQHVRLEQSLDRIGSVRAAGGERRAGVSAPEHRGGTVARQQCDTARCVQRSRESEVTEIAQARSR